MKYQSYKQVAYDMETMQVYAGTDPTEEVPF